MVTNKKWWSLRHSPIFMFFVRATISNQPHLKPNVMVPAVSP